MQELVRSLWQRVMALPMLTRASIVVGVIAAALLIAVLRPRPPELPAGALAAASPSPTPPSLAPPAASASAASSTDARGGLKFKSVLDLRTMLARLNARGPFTWTQREGHYRGEYLSTSIPPSAGVRIFTIPGRAQYLVDIKVAAPAPGAPADYLSVEAVVRAKILSELEATDIQPSLSFD